jgi:TolB-like protein/predicted Zn-dependent protease
MPFEALSDNVRSRTIARGLSQDLSGLFSRWCWFPVIAASSVAKVAHGLSCEELGRQLGARFILSGHLRVLGATWRLGVRIDDTEAGHCLWTEQLDVPAAEVFEAQDRLCESVVAAAYPVLVARAFSGRAFGRPPEDLEAWELAYEAMALHATRERSANERALAYFAQAARREPSLVLAHFGTGLAAYDELLNQWGPTAVATSRLAAAAERCVEAAPHAAEGWYLLGRQAQAKGDHTGAVHPLETAIARNPSFARAHALLAQVLEIAGRHDDALERMQHAVRLGPRSFVAGLASLHFLRGEYSDALQSAERAIATNPRYTFACVLASASAWWLGDAERARQHLHNLRTEYPSFEPAGFLSTFGSNVEAVERIVEALAATEAKV